MKLVHGEDKVKTLILEEGITIEKVLVHSVSLVTVVSGLHKCSRSDARRLIKQGGISVKPRGGELRVVNDDRTMICGNFTIKCGKHDWFYFFTRGHYRNCYE